MIDVVLWDQHFAWSPSYNATHAVGGWECHMVQIAEWLAGRGLEVWALNAGGQEPTRASKVHYTWMTPTTLGENLPWRCRALVTGRHSEIPDWIHADRVVTSVVDDPRHCAETYDHLLRKSTLVCLSEWQAGLYRAMGHECIVIPSAIDDEQYAHGERYPHITGRFVCLNAWNKGSVRTLQEWSRIKAKHPGWRAELRVGSPYSHPKRAEETCAAYGAKWIGQLGPGDVVHELAAAEAVFRVNDKHPETFGVTDAIAEALGTRVHCLCTGEMGAARDVLSSPYLTQDPAEFERGVLFPSLEYPPAKDFRASKALPMWLPVLGLEA